MLLELHPYFALLLTILRQNPANNYVAQSSRFLAVDFHEVVLGSSAGMPSLFFWLVTSLFLRVVVL
uniref:Uncharacterized protein n=1 Tax=Megaselia scalaris TaxID=36166 RepID=T1H3Z3_MEGSC